MARRKEEGYVYNNSDYSYAGYLPDADDEIKHEKTAPSYISGYGAYSSYYGSCGFSGYSIQTYTYQSYTYQSYIYTDDSGNKKRSGK